MIPYNPDPLHVLQQAAGGARVTSEAKDGLPDLYQLPADEDPAVTAARVLVREDLHREKQRKEIIEHFSIVLGGLALLAAYAVYVYQTEGVRPTDAEQQQQQQQQSRAAQSTPCPAGLQGGELAIAALDFCGGAGRSAPSARVEAHPSLSLPITFSARAVPVSA